MHFRFIIEMDAPSRDMIDERISSWEDWEFSPTFDARI